MDHRYSERDERLRARRRKSNIVFTLACVVATAVLGLAFIGILALWSGSLSRPDCDCAPPLLAARPTDTEEGDIEPYDPAPPYEEAPEPYEPAEPYEEYTPEVPDDLPAESPLPQGIALAAGAINAEAARVVVQPGDPPLYRRLVNQHNPLSSSFEPPLRTLAGSHVSVYTGIYEPLTRMMASVTNAGGVIWAQSGFRSYESQRVIFENRVAFYMGQGYGREQAERNTALWVAVPGSSEHQSGLAVDFNCITMAFAGTVAYNWLIDNAHRYGFILRYPQGTTHITGINYEPWHFRYVGIEHATAIWESGITLEEYFKWYYFLR